MGLSIRALSGGRLVGLHKPTTMYMRGWGETYDSALIMFLIEGGESPILVDTGPPDADRVWRYHHYKLEQDPSEVPLEALKRAGVDPDEVKIVINTHLHWDHCSNNKEFPNAKFLIQRDELHYAVYPLEWNRVAFEMIPGLEPAWYSVWHRIEAVDGEVPVALGVSTVPLPGHTPGSQGVLVETDGGRYLIAGDCVPLYENWLGDDTATHIPNGLCYDLGVYAKSFRKIDTLDCEVIPSHDPAVLDRGVFK
jgi:N-acyl homoserine lactone hydrolase